MGLNQEFVRGLRAGVGRVFNNFPCFLFQDVIFFNISAMLFYKSKVVLRLTITIFKKQKAETKA